MLDKIMRNKKEIYLLLFIVLLFNLLIVSAENICQFASSANATSENKAGSLAIYAIGVPNSPKPGCTSWGGYGYSWSPSNWNIKANLTLNYEIPVNVTNFTIFGDYDMCWSKMWLKNSKTGKIKEIFKGNEKTCTLIKKFPDNFLADSIILETCGWSWSVTDAVQLCGKGNNEADNSTNSSKSKGKIYVVPYIGDIDGMVSEDWFFFFNKLIDFHENNIIPAGFSFYPGTMINDYEYKNAIIKMYLSNNVILVQKGFNGNETEARMDELSFEEQKQIIKNGQEHFKLKISEYGIDNAILP